MPKLGDPKTPEQIENDQKSSCDAIGIGLEELLTMDAQELTNKFYFDDNGKNRWALSGMGTEIVDGWFLHDPSPDSLLAGKSKNIPVMIGTVFGDGSFMANTSEDKTVYKMATSGSLEVAKARLANHQMPVYTYLFDRRLPGNDLCPENHSYHSSDLWYVFGTFHRSARPMNGRDFDLSNQVIEYWTNFARSGNPNGQYAQTEWTPYTNDEPMMMVFGDEAMPWRISHYASKGNHIGSKNQYRRSGKQLNCIAGTSPHNMGGPGQRVLLFSPIVQVGRGFLSIENRPAAGSYPAAGRTYLSQYSLV